MLMHEIARGGCTDTVRESALKTDSEKKLPSRTGDSNPRQYYAWLFTKTLYQLGCFGPNKTKAKDFEALFLICCVRFFKRLFTYVVQGSLV